MVIWQIIHYLHVRNHQFPTRMMKGEMAERIQYILGISFWTSFFSSRTAELNVPTINKGLKIKRQLSIFSSTILIIQARYIGGDAKELQVIVILGFLQRLVELLGKKTCDHLYFALIVTKDACFRWRQVVVGKELDDYVPLILLSTGNLCKLFVL